MKTSFPLILAASLVISGAAMAAGEYDTSPKYGGVVVEAKHVDYEIVAKPEMIQIYLSDHGKQMKVAGAKARVTLLNGSEKSEVDLVPVGDKLEAKGAFKVAKGTKGIALVTLAGKSAVSVRFDVK